MSFRSAFIDCVHVVRWIAPLTSDVAPMVREVSAARLSFGRPIYGISIVPTDCKVPTDDARVAMGKAMGAILESLDTIHFVMEGTGFAHSVRRSALSGMLLLGGKRGRIIVHADLDAALKELAPHLSLSTDEFKKQARAAGVLGGPAPTATPIKAVQRP